MLDQHERPSSPIGVFEIPAGFIREIPAEDENEDSKLVLYNTVTLKEMTGHEEDIFSNDKIPFVDRIHMIISRCITRMDSDDGSFIEDVAMFRNMPHFLLTSDNLVLFIRLRQITVGNKYAFDVRCPECKVEQPKVVDLSKLETKSIKGDPFKRVREIHTKSGKIVTWEMMTGKIDKENANEKIKISSKEKATQILLNRVRTIDGKPVDKKTLKDLSFNDREDIRSHFDEEGGVETSMDVTCNSCGCSFEQAIPIGGVGFFTRSEDHPEL